MSNAKVITVSGAHGGVGKTLLIERLIPSYPNCAGIKVQARGDGNVSVISEDDPGQSPGKDTSRYLLAGAKRAFLVRGSGEAAMRAVRDIVEQDGFDTLIVESNAAARELTCDLSFHVEGSREEKPGAEACRRRADVRVCGMPSERTRR